MRRMARGITGAFIVPLIMLLACSGRRPPTSGAMRLVWFGENSRVVHIQGKSFDGFFADSMRIVSWRETLEPVRLAILAIGRGDRTVIVLSGTDARREIVDGHGVIYTACISVADFRAGDSVDLSRSSVTSYFSYTALGMRRMTRGFAKNLIGHIVTEKRVGNSMTGRAHFEADVTEASRTPDPAQSEIVHGRVVGDVEFQIRKQQFRKLGQKVQVVFAVLEDVIKD